MDIRAIHIRFRCGGGAVFAHDIKKTRQYTRVSPKAACILLRNRAVQSAGCFWASGNLIGKLFLQTFAAFLRFHRQSSRRAGQQAAQTDGFARIAAVAVVARINFAQ